MFLINFIIVLLIVFVLTKINSLKIKLSIVVFFFLMMAGSFYIMECLEMNSSWHFPVLVSLYERFDKNKNIAICYYNRVYARKMRKHKIDKFVDMDFYIKSLNVFPLPKFDYDYIFCFSNTKKYFNENINGIVPVGFDDEKIYDWFLKNVSPEKKVLFICFGGHSSSVVTVKLRLMGYSKVYFTSFDQINVKYCNEEIKSLLVNDFDVEYEYFDTVICLNNCLADKNINNKNIIFIDMSIGDNNDCLYRKIKGLISINKKNGNMKNNKYVVCGYTSFIKAESLIRDLAADFKPGTISYCQINRF